MDQIPIPLIEKFLKEDIRDADYLKMLDGTNMKTIVENENFRIDSQKVKSAAASLFTLLTKL